MKTAFDNPGKGSTIGAAAAAALRTSSRRLLGITHTEWISATRSVKYSRAEGIQRERREADAACEKFQDD